MELQEITVEGRHSQDMPWAETIVMPLGDLQYGSEGSDLDLFKKYIDWGVAHDAYYILMGDLVDVLSPSGRTKVKSANFYDSVEAAISEIVTQHEDKVIGLLKPTRGRVLGVLRGHHYTSHLDSTESDTRIAQALEAPFLGDCGMIRLKFQHDTSKASPSIVIWCHHGHGSGQLASSPLNKLEKLTAYFEADIYMIAHFSRQGILPIQRLYMSGRRPLKLRHRTKLLVATGAYVRGYTQGSKKGNLPSGSYIEKGLMSPTAIGSPFITLTPQHSNDEDRVLVGGSILEL